MRTGIEPRGAAVALVAVLAVLSAHEVQGGEIADGARRAERLIAESRTAEALTELDGAVDAFWREMPLHFRTAVFAETGSIEAFGKYRPREGAFRRGETVTIYVEPVGYGFFVTGATMTIDLAAGLEIRSPGGIVFAQAAEFGRLEWTGRSRSREVHGDISVTLPELKPGDYEIVMTLTDEATGKAAQAALPFAISE